MCCDAWSYFLYLSTPLLLVLIAWIFLVIGIYLNRLIIVCLHRQQHIHHTRCLPAPSYPHKDPFFGYDLFRANLQAVKNSKLLETWTDRFRQYGDTFTANFLGTPAICTVDPLNVQVFLGTEFENYGVQPLRRKATLPFLGEGVFTMDGSFWQYSRDLIKPTFSRANIADLASFDFHVERLFRNIPRGGQTVDLKPLLCQMFIDSSTEFLFGESMGILSGFAEPRLQEFMDAFHYAQKGTATRMQLGKLDFLHRDKKYWEAIKIVNEVADYYVDKALEYRKYRKQGLPDMKQWSNKDRYVLLEQMALETDDRQVLRNQIIHIFLAGHESTAITIGNAVFQLCRNPKIWEKLKADVLVHGRERPTLEKMKKMTYLRYVIDEIVRLYPVASTATRVAYRDTVLPRGGGSDRRSRIFVKRGTIVMTPTYSLHRLAKCFQPDPNTFRPERWEELALIGHPLGPSYIPFGWAPRTCPARHMAEVQVAYTLARMAQEWESIECRDDTLEWIEEIRLSTSSKNGTKVGVIFA